MSELQPDPWKTLAAAVDVLFLEVCKALHIPQAVEWLANVINRITKKAR